MEKTSQYQLNQWAAGDRILREDFNRDNANVEAGLVALGQRVTAEQAAREQAVNSAVTQLDTAKAEKSELVALKAQVEAMPFVKLRDITVSTAAVQVDVDMSSIDLSQYAYILLAPVMATDNETVLLRVNGISDGYSYNVDGNSKTYLVYMRNMLNTYCHLIRLLGTGSQLAALAENVGYNGNGYDQRSIMTSSSGVTPATVQTLNFVMEDSTAQIPTGSKIIMYGVKL